MGSFDIPSHACNSVAGPLDFAAVSVVGRMVGSRPSARPGPDNLPAISTFGPCNRSEEIQHVTPCAERHPPKCIQQSFLIRLLSLRCPIAL